MPYFKQNGIKSDIGCSTSKNKKYSNDRMVKKIYQTILKHKFISAVIALLVIGGGTVGVRALRSGSTEETRYVLSQAEKGTLSTTISGSGQVSASNQVDLKAKASGEVVTLVIKNGQKVKTGDVLLTLNSGDAYENVRDAQDNLESARLSLAKLTKSADERSMLQAENALATAKNNLEKLKLSQEIEKAKSEESQKKAEDDLETAYEDAYDALSETFIDIPDVMSGLYNVLLSYEIMNSEPGYGVYTNDGAFTMHVRSSDEDDYIQISRLVETAVGKYHDADEVFESASEEFSSLSRGADTAVVDAVLNESVSALIKISDTVKSTLALLSSWVEYRETHELKVFDIVKEYKTDTENFVTTVNSNLSSVRGIQEKIRTSKQTIVDEERSLREMELNNPFEFESAEKEIKDKELALAELDEGADELELRQAQITVRQRQTALTKAQKELANYAVNAPFDGVIASVDAKKGETISSGGAIATLITDQRIAEISLNEVDVAQVEVGQKVNLTFDAVDDLQITGSVAEVSSIGTANQGVVSYDVVIIFDTQDERIKPGMSVSATIITEIKQGVITVPIGAVKTQGDISYVEVVDDETAIVTNGANGVALGTAPRQQVVEVGISNDTIIEIVSGLNEGDYVVSRTITATAGTGTTQTQSAPSLFGNTGAGQTRQGVGGGGTMQFPR